MAKNLLHYTCYFIVLTSFVDQGHGRWKRRDKENLQHDIDTFKEMAEKIEREIEAFYDDYSDEQIKGDDIGKIHQKYVQQSPHKPDIRKIAKNRKSTQENFHFTSTANITNKILPVKAKSHQSDTTEPNIHFSFSNGIQSTKDSNAFSSNWPKFEDILLAIGKRYDWKNDRWIKVKKKLRESRMKRVQENSRVHFLEKHKFSYRTVKLAGSKSRRNVVIAVSAIR